MEPKVLVTLLREVEPDVLLLDWGLGDGSSPELLSLLKERHPKMVIVALSGRPEMQRAALEAGADAFFSKGDHPCKLLAVLHSMNRNDQ